MTNEAVAFSKTTSYMSAPIGPTPVKLTAFTSPHDL
jgi:hypothetical protein